VDIPYSPNEPRSIRLLFTRIARNYDRTNHVISFGFDVVWRKKFARLLKGRNRIADVCCGSGAMIPLLGSRIRAGLDFTHAMLQVAKEQAPATRLVEGDAQKIPFLPASFDAAIIVYSIRNIPDVPAALSELYRILESGGLLAILDFGVPEGKYLNWLYLLYFQKIMPFIGSWVAKDKPSYYYFVNSVLKFPKRNAFLEWMRSAGFQNCRYLEYLGGAALIYLADKV
jgi:demethylmenaquinone methyltransferase / 2-methoxy-6-polyprenyl-1,4-benzoquinol methylase